MRTKINAKAKKAKKGKQEKWTLVSFFSGCGGLDLGFAGGFTYKKSKRAKLPYKILAAYDNDPKCVATYLANIRKFGNQHDAKILDLSKFQPKSLPPADVLIGGFPCQEFALCGPRRGLKSERGKLYKALIKYAEVHKPKILVAENVPGLASISEGEMLKTIQGEIKRAGYNVRVWQMYAPDYGVPQNRSRIFIICVRNDLKGFPEEPKRTHLYTKKTAKWALQDLEKITCESVPNQSQYFKAARAKQGHGQGDETLVADKPAHTIRANAKSRIQFHYALDRRLTVRECARLQTFPDDFVFPHAATTNIMQIGNAVPPILAHTVANTIAIWLKGTR